MTWTTITAFVDHETGEALTEQHIKKGNYLKIGKEIKYKRKSEDHGIRYITWKCEKNRQQEIGF